MNFSTGVLDHIVISPSSASISADGGSQIYTVTGYDATNHSLGDLTGHVDLHDRARRLVRERDRDLQRHDRRRRTPSPPTTRAITDTATLTVNAGAPSTVDLHDHRQPGLGRRRQHHLDDHRAAEGRRRQQRPDLGRHRRPLVHARHALRGHRQRQRHLHRDREVHRRRHRRRSPARSTPPPSRARPRVTFVPGPATHFVVTAPGLRDRRHLGRASPSRRRTRSTTRRPATSAPSTSRAPTAPRRCPANYGFVSGDTGVNTFPVTLKTAGSQTVTATDTVTGIDQRHDRARSPSARARSARPPRR